MKDIRVTAIKTVKNTIPFAKWLVAALIVGACGGVVGSIFHILLDIVTEKRMENSLLILFLPIGGIVIAALYSLFKSVGKLNTDRVMEAVSKNENVPLAIVPLIFISTIITHLFGGSAGREGAALQIGGSIGYNIGKLCRMDEKDLHIIVMCGMSAVFSALFGTPVTAAIFSIEVAFVGAIRYGGLFPCVLSAYTARSIAKMFGLSPICFSLENIASMTAPNVARVIVLAFLCAIVSILFCVSIHKSEKYMKKFISNSYIRAFAGGTVMVLFTILLRTTDYNGAGMDVIENAISGTAKPEAFILKIVLTAICIAAGFKGGEIVPTMFIGATFGCVVGGLLGLDPGFGAAIGLVSLFCGVVNCPVASLFLSIELFGVEGIVLFAVACSVSYMMSGHSSLYKSQRFLFSKLTDEYEG